LTRGRGGLLVCAVILFLSPQEAYSTGIYRDYTRFSSFLTAPQQLALYAGVTRTRAPQNEAAIYTLATWMPFRLFLFELRLPYVSFVTSDNIQDGFGDPALNLRFKAWAGEQKVLYLLSGVRLGSFPFLLSNEDLFPYSTGSLDFSIGIAFVDTLVSVTWWISAIGTHPTRVDDALEDSDLYGSYSTVGAGIQLPLKAGFGLQTGAIGYIPNDRSLRQIFFADLDWRYSDVTGFYGYFQAEGGSRDERAADYSFGVGTKITF
jgi:hypothetical protein